jgi:hypothetical protein
MEGVFGAMIVGDINGLDGVIELAEGRPPLVWGRTGPGEAGDNIESGTGGGEIVMLGVSGGYCDCGLSLPFLGPLENSLRPAGSVDTGR